MYEHSPAQPARQSGGERAAVQALREVRGSRVNAPASWTAAALRRFGTALHLLTTTNMKSPRATACEIRDECGGRQDKPYATAPEAWRSLRRFAPFAGLAPTRQRPELRRPSAALEQRSAC